MTRFRLNRHGKVVPERRRFSATWNTDAWNADTDRIFAPRRSSPARDRFKAERSTRRNG